LGHDRLRETAVVFNRILSQEQFWDGRAKSLEEQLRFPLESADEFHTTTVDCIERIKNVEGYQLQFEAIFGRLDYDSLSQAIAAFERTLVTGPSAWDYEVELQRLEALDAKSLSAEEKAWLATVRSAAQNKPLTDSARRGASLFFGNRSGCSQCHSGPNFTDEQYHDIGLRTTAESNSPVSKKEREDLGRFHVTGQKEDRHKFKTPTLRNVAQTWPYMHDGRYTRLEQVAEHFVRGGDAESSDIHRLDLNDAEIQDLVAFLQSLTGSLPQPPTDRLPP
jgi:cytochrome c peroxidase